MRDESSKNKDLIRSERQLEDFFENANVPLHWVGPEGTILRANRAELDLLGYRRDEYVGHHISEFHVDGPVIDDILDRLTRGEELTKYPARLRHKDGSIRHVEISSSVLFKGGEFVHTRCVTVDVTERRRAEEEFKKSEERYRRLAELLPVAVYTCDAPSGVISYYNAAATRLWGRAPRPDDTDERFCGSFQMSWPDGTPRPYEECPMAIALEEGRSFRNEEIVLTRPDGSRITILVNSDPILDDAGEVSGAINVFQDMSELKEAENALREADRRKDEFLAILAHELRNPLAPITNALRIMRDSDGDLLEDAYQVMERQLAHLVRLVDDLLDVSRITQGKLELRREPVEIRSVIDRAIETCRPFLDDTGHDLAVDLPSEPIRLRGDPVRLAQVFGNLIHNACKYTEPPGKIRVRAEPRDGIAVVSVEDDGMGLSPEVLAHLFEGFDQPHRRLGQAKGGLGIGLMLVKRLVEMHGGSVEAFSEGSGEGSEFVVRLPLLLESEEDPAPESPMVEQSSTGRRILVVDDNHDAASSLAMLLEMAGHETHTAHDGPEATESAEKLRPDVLLLDIGLPEMSGHDVCRAIRRRPWGEKAVIVAVTGWGREGDRRKSREAGFDGHLVKPIQYEDVVPFLTVDRPEAAPD